jgi:ABC-2 type transport system ATP-binding protein
MVTARALCKSFGSNPALRGIDLHIERRELFALIGPDGAGKTTFFRLVAGLLSPTSGSVSRSDGVDFGYVPQRFSLYEDLSIDENLNLRLSLYGIPGREGKSRASDLLERVGLLPFRDRLAGALSGGMKQKLALVAALLTRPGLLLLDEPTTGVDPVSRREFWLLLNALHHDGLTVVVSTPYMDEAEYAGRIGFLDEGRLSALGNRRQILASYDRGLLEVRTSERMVVRQQLSSIPAVDDVSSFGTRLHVRGARNAGKDLLDEVRKALSDLVPAEEIQVLEPSLEDVFVLRSEETAG